jgi:hypothetical protein
MAYLLVNSIRPNVLKLIVNHFFCSELPFTLHQHSYPRTFCKPGLYCLRSHDWEEINIYLAFCFVSTWWMAYRLACSQIVLILTIRCRTGCAQVAVDCHFSILSIHLSTQVWLQNPLKAYRLPFVHCSWVVLKWATWYFLLNCLLFSWLGVSTFEQIISHCRCWAKSNYQIYCFWTHWSDSRRYCCCTGPVLRLLIG